MDGRFQLNATSYYYTIDATPANGLDPRINNGKDRIWVDVDCNYTKTLLVHAIARRRSELIQIKSPEDATVLWAEYEELDWDRILEGQVRGNSYLVRKGLGRKAQLAYHLKKYLSKRPNSVMNLAFPETMVIETWEAFEEEMSFGALGAKFDRGLTSTLSSKERLEWCLRDASERLNQDPEKLWILKPSVTNKGAEIYVINSYQALYDAIWQWSDIREWVLQSYVDRPLLFRERKFHLRCYVLAVGDLSVYVWRQVLLLSSALPYNREDLTNSQVHITNTARQVEEGGAGFEDEECVHLLDDLVEDLLRSSSSSSQRPISLADAQECVQQIQRKMEEVTAELFQALHGERTVFAPLPNCFELLGLDFLVSWPTAAELTQPLDVAPERGPVVHLLEVNPGPDFKQTGSRLRRVVQGLLEATLDIAVLSKTPAAEMHLVYENLEAGVHFHGGATSSTTTQQGQQNKRQGGMRLLHGE